MAKPNEFRGAFVSRAREQPDFEQSRASPWQEAIPGKPFFFFAFFFSLLEKELPFTERGECRWIVSRWRHVLIMLSAHGPISKEFFPETLSREITSVLHSRTFVSLRFSLTSFRQRSFFQRFSIFLSIFLARSSYDIDFGSWNIYEEAIFLITFDYISPISILSMI